MAAKDLSAYLAQSRTLTRICIHTHTHTHLCVCVFLFVEIDIIFGGARLDVATYGGQSKHEGAICEQAHSKYFSFEQGAFVAK